MLTIRDLLDVENVLNENDIQVLSDFLYRSPIASNNKDVLTNILC